MPPQSKKSPTAGKDIETATAPVLGADRPAAGVSIQDASPPITEHEPKTPIEKSDLPDSPVKTSGAVPVSQVTADKIDEAATTAMVMIDHPIYGKISLADLEEVMRAEIKAEVKSEVVDPDEALPEICGRCFPEGWNSKNAAGQDGVGCEHGSWNKTQLKPKR